MRQIYLNIDSRRCQLCAICLAAKACRVRAISRIDEDDFPFLDPSRCYDCRLCIPACPSGAVQSSLP